MNISDFLKIYKILINWFQTIIVFWCVIECTFIKGIFCIR